MVHELTRTQARRIAVTAQLLQKDRPADLHDLVRHLAFLQVDPVDAIAPNAHLVTWSRLGSSYDRADLDGALARRTLVELDALIRPAEDIRLYRADMANWISGNNLLDWQKLRTDWVTANDACRRDILERLETSGPLLSRDLPDTCVKPWKSTGWTNNKNVTQMLSFMAARGEVAVAGRKGRQRLWDLASRVYPDEPAVPMEEALEVRNERRLRALGIARARTQQAPVEAWDVGEAGEPAVVEGVKGDWRVDPTYLGAPFKGRAALLSPFDRLVHDRKRTADLFEFEYYLEMYKPANQRRWGYFALPILYGDRLVGKLDATKDKKEDVLRVNAIHQDAPFTKTMTAAVTREITALAHWLEMDLQLQ